MFLFIMYQKLEVTQALRNTVAEQQTLNPAESNKLKKMCFDVTYHRATAHSLEKWENILALKQV